MESVTLIGLMAGALTTIAFFPQLHKAWTSKSTKDVSISMYVIFCTGIFLWLIYGLMIDSLPVILANAVTFVLALSILVLKIKYR
jgi:MtN3 and saliva related transmembrane protein